MLSENLLFTELQNRVIEVDTKKKYTRNIVRNEYNPKIITNRIYRGVNI